MDRLVIGVIDQKLLNTILFPGTSLELVGIRNNLELGAIHNMAGMLKGLKMKKILNYYSVPGTSLELGGIRNNPWNMFMEYWLECRTMG